VIGRHYIIPSAILVGAVLFGNIAKYGFQDQPWAKQILFWSGFLFTGHAFFALFFAKIYRLWLGDSFEFICGIVVVVFGYLLFEYARRNQILNS
jgi:F0F1-type ATP synthase assembly protein I